MRGFQACFLSGLALTGVGVLGSCWTRFGPVGLYRDSQLFSDAKWIFFSILGLGLALVAGGIGRGRGIFFPLALVLALSIGQLAGAAPFEERSFQSCFHAAVVCIHLWLWITLFCQDVRQKREAGAGGSLASAAQTMLFTPRQGMGLLACVPVLALAYPMENVRGKAAWDRFLEDQRRLGIPTTLAEWLGPQIPDELNFCKAPGVPRFVARGEPTRVVWMGAHPGGNGDVELKTLLEAAELDRTPLPPLDSRLASWAGTSREIALDEPSFVQALDRLLAGSGVRYRLHRDAESKLRSSFHFQDSRFTFRSQAEDNMTALKRFLSSYGMRVAFGDRDGTLVIGTRPPSPEAVLDWYARWQHVIEAMQHGAKRPDATLVFSGTDTTHSFWALFQMRPLVQGLCAHANALILLGDQATAVQNAIAVLRLSQASSTHPSLVGGWLTGGLAGICGYSVEEWMEAGVLSDPVQSEKLSKELRAVELLGRFGRGLQVASITTSGRVLTQTTGEMLAAFFDQLRTYAEKPPFFLRRAVLLGAAFLADTGPVGWRYQAALRHSKFMAETAVRMIRRDSQGFFIDLRDHPLPVPHGLPLSPYDWPLFGSGPEIEWTTRTINEPIAEWRSSFVWTAKFSARAQVRIDQAVIALSLERYRMSVGRYPDSLTELVPALSTELPRDVVGGAPMKYVRLGNDSYKLYSIGWDGVDDGGRSSGNDVGGVPGTDWVWKGPPRR